MLNVLQDKMIINAHVIVFISHHILSPLSQDWEANTMKWQGSGLLLYFFYSFFYLPFLHSYQSTSFLAVWQVSICVVWCCQNLVLVVRDNYGYDLTSIDTFLQLAHYGNVTWTKLRLNSITCYSNISFNNWCYLTTTNISKLHIATIYNGNPPVITGSHQNGQ